MRRELQASLRDVGQVPQAAGVEDRAGQVGVGAADQVDQGQQREDGERSGDDSRAERAPPRPRSRDRGDGRADREDDRGADVGAEAARGEDDSRRRGRRRGRATAAPARGQPAPRKPVKRRPGPGDDQDRQQRLELVADPVEADPEPGIRAQADESEVSGEPAMTSTA